jgi:AsmA protein
MIDGTASLDGFYKPIQKDKAAFSMDLNADHLNIKKGFESIVLFQELMPAAEKAAGFISVAYNLTGTLDQDMLPELPSLKGKGSVAVDSIQFADYKLFSSLSKKSGFNALDNPKISEIKIYSEIDNNVLEIERFKYRVKHIRLRTEGQISLDGSLGLKMRIGIPPFGLIGIPVVVKGTHEDFKVKLGKRAPDMKAVDTLGGSFSEADLLRVKMLRDSIKSDMTIQEIDAMQQKIQGLSLDSLRLKSTDSIPIPNQEQE